MTDSKKIPVTILTGFLGSGKTTLLSHILQSKDHKLRIAIIENEFAAPIGLKNEVKPKEKGENEHLHDHENPFDNASCVAEISETTNGCLCCSGKGDFLVLLEKLIENKERFDYLIVETTGMADPSFASVFLENRLLKQHYFLDGIVTMVDAKNASFRLSQQFEQSKKGPTFDENGMQVVHELMEQIAYADRIIVNKTDTIGNDPKILKKLEEEIREINSTTSISRTQFSKVDVSSILNIQSFNVERILKLDSGFLDFRPGRTHDGDITSLTLVGLDAIDIDKFRVWFEKFLKDKGKDILRTKGVVRSSKGEEKWVYQGVQDSFELFCHSKWSEKEDQKSKFVFIGKNLNLEKITTDFYNQVGVEISYLPKEGLEDSGKGSLVRLFGILFIIYAIKYPDQSWDLATSYYTWIFLALCTLAFLFYSKRKEKKE